VNRSGAGVVAAWAAGNGVLTAILVAYGGPTLDWRAGLFAGGSFLVLVAAGLVMVVRNRERSERPGGGENVGQADKDRTEPSLPSGGPAIAAAAAVFVGGFAWVFGVYLAYLAVPLLAYAFGKWWAEDRRPSEAA
jgi:hypothetical protein